MEVTYQLPKSRFPHEHEIRATIKRLCERAELSPENASVRCMGYGRRSFFSQRGIKLLGTDPFAVRIYVGCNNDTIEATLAVKNGGGRAMSGSDLFAKLESSLSGKVFIPGHEKIRSQASIHHTTVFPSTPGQSSTAQSGPDDSAAETKQKTVNESTQTETSFTTKNTLKETTDMDKPNGYFDDPATLHLVVSLLVIKCNENTNAPLTFSDFCKILDEANVPKVGPRVSQVRPLLARNFLKKISVEGTKSRYVITEAAVAFCRGPVPTSPVPKVTKPKKERPHTERRPAHDDVARTIAYFKRVSDEHRATLAALEVAKKRLSEINLSKDVDEDSKAAGEMANLEKRLDELRKFRSQIAERREEANETEQTIHELEAKAANPETLSVLSELKELVSQLG